MGDLEQPTCKKLFCWPAGEVVADGGASWGFALWPRASGLGCPAREQFTKLLVRFVSQGSSEVTGDS